MVASATKPSRTPLICPMRSTLNFPSRAMTRSSGRSNVVPMPGSSVRTARVLNAIKGVIAIFLVDAGTKVARDGLFPDHPQHRVLPEGRFEVWRPLVHEVELRPGILREFRIGRALRIERGLQTRVRAQQFRRHVLEHI